MASDEIERFGREIIEPAASGQRNCRTVRSWTT